MKRILTISWILSALWISAVGQTSQLEYLPFAQDGKIWGTQVGLIMENVYYNEIDGDTVIDGENWKKVYNYVFPKTRYCSYYAAIRDVGKQVYAIAKGHNRPRLLYDFGLKVGDIVKCGVEGNTFGCLLDQNEEPDTLLGFPFVSYLKVERIDTVKARGLEHRRFTLTLLDAFRESYMKGEEAVIDNVVWIEGIGSGAGPFSPWIPLPPYTTFLQGCELDGTCLFGYPDFYDADISDSVGSTYYKESYDSSSFDLSGRRLSESPAGSVPSVLPKGVYIRDGRKVLVK